LRISTSSRMFGLEQSYATDKPILTDLRGALACWMAVRSHAGISVA